MRPLRDQVPRVLRKYRQLARAAYVRTDPARVFVYRLLHRDVAAVPPVTGRIRAGDMRIGNFMEAGRNCHQPIRTAIDTYQVRSERQPPRLLDFGCGVGRVLQYFARDGKEELWACDVDVAAIAYLHRAFPAIRATVSHYAPPLQYPDGHFDLIYSVSVWTHLAPHLQVPWLLEMRRLLAPNGLALLTTIGPFGYRNGTHLAAVTFSLEDLLRDGFCYSEYKTRYVFGGPSYGAAYHTPAYVKKEWSAYFDVLEVREGVVDNLNDLVVLRKTS